ncbi:FAD-linked oxidase C-terminal domain-containing protein [Marihabitans asiaticum]|uniref:Glycolate oxidase n=1 Tax=Marihabitans asiaticum TaxID=415218 RepID=A0A560WEK5_9MICO|nr:FAD-linked oxidase C-terminal domain-containing protein [Marihabitans asiaticum]TWD16092.1 glycolate oxidase [Marihabitans asiaticum]
MSQTIDLSPLLAELDPDQVVIDPDRVQGYRWDRAEDPAAGTPAVVVRAGSTADVQVAMRFAAAHRMPVVPRGAGSGLSGGASAVEGCMVISTERMRELAIDPSTRTAVVGPGLMNAEVKAAASEHGLWYPPDPSSYEFCSIGGNIATNAGGLCCVKYGVTTDYVLGLTVVLADGSVVRLGGPRVKDVAGLPLTKLFVGSEGTLGIVTEIVLRLLPKQRRAATLVATFADLDAAIGTVLDITARMRPSMLELMDATTIGAVEDDLRMGLDREAAAMLVIQSDEPAGTAAEEIEQIGALCESRGASEVVSTDDPDEGAMFVTARRAALVSLEKQGRLLLEDVGVPLPRLGDLLAGIADIAAARDVTIAVVAHAGDGNTHPTLVLDPSDPAMAERAQQAYGEIIELTLSLGGTISGEHGIGRLKRPWLADQLGEDVMALNRKIKEALDPFGILNPGAGI